MASPLSVSALEISGLSPANKLRCDETTTTATDARVAGLKRLPGRRPASHWSGTGNGRIRIQVRIASLLINICQPIRPGSPAKWTTVASGLTIRLKVAVDPFRPLTSSPFRNDPFSTLVSSEGVEARPRPLGRAWTVSPSTNCFARRCGSRALPSMPMYSGAITSAPSYAG